MSPFSLVGRLPPPPPPPPPQDRRLWIMIYTERQKIFFFVRQKKFITINAVKAQTSLAPLSRFRGSRVTIAHAHQCCIFQSYAKTVPSRMKLTMKLTMREPTFMGSMTTGHVITACDV